MSEINDLVLPVLKKIQSDLSEVKIDLGEVKIDLGEVKQKLDTVEGYVTYHMGITFQHKGRSRGYAKGHRRPEEATGGR